MPKIAIHQSKNGNMDPTIQITLTEHENYLKGALVTDNIDYALEKIKKWMEGKLKQV